MALNYITLIMRELCQPRDNLYSCDIYIDTTDINSMFGETIRNVYGCSCNFVVVCYGCV